MKTTGGSVSTICYAEKNFLEARLKTLIGCFWMLVEHSEYIVKETGEVRKRHCHLYLEVINGERVNLDKLRTFLEQPSTEPNTPALGVMPFRGSKASDWLPYALHDSDYCHYKGLTKPYYDIPMADVETNNKSFADELFISLPRDRWISPIRRMLRAQEQGLSLLQFLDRESIPYNLINSVTKAWRDLVSAGYLKSIAEGYARIEERTDFVDQVDLKKDITKIRNDKREQLALPFDEEEEKP